MRLKGEGQEPGGRISANARCHAGAGRVDADGLARRDNVQLTLPGRSRRTGADRRAPDARRQGEAGRGLTRRPLHRRRAVLASAAATSIARLSGGRSKSRSRRAQRRSKTRSSRGVSLRRWDMIGDSRGRPLRAAGGHLELTGSEPGPDDAAGRQRPDRRRCHADRRRAVGPVVKATGAVEERAEAGAGRRSGSRRARREMPSMLNEDQAVIVAAPASSGLRRQGGEGDLRGQMRSCGRATRRSRAERSSSTSRPAISTAGGSVSRRSHARQTRPRTARRSASRSIATANDSQYEEAQRRATYTGEAHMSGAAGRHDRRAIELFCPTGDELERLEAYDERSRCATSRTARPPAPRMTVLQRGRRRYVVTGTPVERHRRVRPRDDRPDVDLLQSAPIGSSSTAASRTARRPGAAQCPLIPRR